MNWIALTELNQLKEIAAKSSDKPILIFKHSTRCGISRMVLKNFEKEYDIEDSEMDSYFLDLLKFRNISNEVASQYKVYHQSPQIIVIKNNEVIYNASHGDIVINTLKEILKNKMF